MRARAMHVPETGTFTHSSNNWAKHHPTHLGGKVTPGNQPGTFAGLHIANVDDGDDPTVEVRNGGPGGELVCALRAKAGAVIDRSKDPVRCPAGIHVVVHGNPSRLDATLLYSIG